MTEKKKNPLKPKDPVERLAALRHEFGEHGGVNMSIEASTTFTVMEAGTMPEIFKDGSVQTLVVVFYTADTSTQPFTYLVVRLPRWMARKQATALPVVGGYLLRFAWLTLARRPCRRLRYPLWRSWAMLAEFLPQKCGIGQHSST